MHSERNYISVHAYSVAHSNVGAMVNFAHSAMNVEKVNRCRLVVFPLDCWLMRK